VAAVAAAQAQSESADATAVEQQAADTAVIDSLKLQCTELHDALARSSSSTSNIERANTQSQQALQQLQQEHSAEVTRLECELTALQQQLDQQVSSCLLNLHTLCFDHHTTHTAYPYCCMHKRSTLCGSLITSAYISMSYDAHSV
jgi:hypothetical protein